MDSRLFTLSTSDTVTLYWDKPAAGSAYEVYMNGERVGTPPSTHITLDGLEPDTLYFFSVRMGEKTLEAEARTKKRRRRLDVTKLGAVGDGRTMNTAVLQAAFDACTEDAEVYIPEGVYLTGALRMHGGMALYIDRGAVLQGTDAPEDYLPRIPSRFEGMEMECYSSLLNLGELDRGAGPNCENVLIYGHGTIASGGQTLGMRVIELERERLRGYMNDNAASVKECENESTMPGRARPRLINMSNCRDVRVTGLTLMNGASWNVHMIYCDGIVTDNCVFRSEGVWNGDGWDPDSSERCTLFASRFYTEDDSVAIKSGKNPEGNIIARPSREIRVFDCASAFGHGICIGSEMSGGVEDVMIWDCDLRDSLSGLEIKGTKKRGGYVRNITVRDCALPRVMLHSVPYNDDGVPAPKPPVFEDCLFEGLLLTGRCRESTGDKEYSACAAVEISGFDAKGHEARNIVFRDLTLSMGAGSIRLERCEGVRFEGIRCL